MPSLSRRLLETLAAGGDIDVAVETGTFRGDGARILADYFPRVITVERDSVLARDAASAFSGTDRVEVVHAHSADFLRSLKPGDGEMFFFLDGHWSGGGTAGVDDECPVMAELDAIAGLVRNPCIVIDDARMFLAPPPAPHDPAHWPSVQELLRFVDQTWPDALIVVVDDRFIIVGEQWQGGITRYAQLEAAGHAGPSMLGRLRAVIR